jgi:choline dehydrogenase-like flavoprotein
VFGWPGYYGRDRGGPAGVVSLTQTTTRDGRRSSTYQAFLAGEPEQRPNLTIITGAQATRVLLAGQVGRTVATGQPLDRLSAQLLSARPRARSSALSRHRHSASRAHSNGRR